MLLPWFQHLSQLHTALKGHPLTKKPGSCDAGHLFRNTRISGTRVRAKNPVCRSHT